MTSRSVSVPTRLLGGLTPKRFMQRHWQRQPLLIRQALPMSRPPVSSRELRQLARSDEVESRLIRHDRGQWQLDSGPFQRLPAARSVDWTLLVQGVDLHHDAVAELRDRFRFVPDARLDDVMISLAGPGGGVGPHFDSYDVFLLQAHGRRRWQISAQKDLDLRPDLPLKVLQNFRPDSTYELVPGDMLYLPPHIAHDGVALDPDCITISIGFRAPTHGDLLRILLEGAADRLAAQEGGRTGRQHYRDPGQPATDNPAVVPERLLAAAQRAVLNWRWREQDVADILGQWLTEPKAGVFFEPPDDPPDLLAHWPAQGLLALDRRSRFHYRDSQGWINGESLPLRVSAILRDLADQRHLRLGKRPPTQATRCLLQEWLEAGWLHWRPD